MRDTSLQSETPRQAADWVDLLNRASAARQAGLLELAEQAVKECPTDSYVLYLAALAALLEQNPARCLRYLQRLQKHFIPDNRDLVLRAIALAQQGVPLGGYQLLRDARITTPMAASFWFAGSPSLRPWFKQWLNTIFASALPPAKPARKQAPAPAKSARAAKKAEVYTPAAPSVEPEAAAMLPEFPELPKYHPDIPVRFELTNAAAILLDGQSAE